LFSQAIALPTLILLSFSSIWLIITTDWRVRLGLLALLYFGEFIFLSLSWPVSMAVSKLVAGWMAAAVLGMALISNPTSPTGIGARFKFIGNSKLGFFQYFRIQPATIFYLIAAILVGLVTFSVSAVFTTWIPDSQEVVIWAGLLVLGLGILQLGFRADVFSTILGILTMVAGFEIIYASIEHSTLVAGLLAVITLGLALVGAYLILSPQIEEGE